MNQIEQTLTSLEVAEMVGRRHDQVMRDIDNIIGHLGGDHKSVESYFIHSNYENSQRKTFPCYKLTKKGCELYSTRMTGEKGTQFAVAYIERFNQMENLIKKNEIDTSKLSPELQMFKQIFDSVALTQLKQQEQDKRLDAVERQQENIKEVLSLNPTEWKKKVNLIINAIAQSRGGFQVNYAEVRKESYQLLEERAKCRLSIRLTNKKSEMALNGASKSKIEKVNKMDVIADDARLTEIYLAIVKEMAIKNNVEVA